MLRHRFVVLLSLIGYVTADADPGQTSYTRNNDPIWMPLACINGFHCPLMQRRQYTGYSEVCFSSSPNWFSFKWEKYATHFDQLEAIGTIRSLTQPFYNTSFLQSLYEANQEHYIEKNFLIASVTHLKYHQNQNKYVINYFFMVPKLKDGEFEIPCTGEHLMPLMQVIGANSCAEFASKFVTNRPEAPPAPKCFYAVEKNNGDDDDDLDPEIEWDENEALKLGIISDDLSVKEWHLAPNDLYNENDD